MLKTLRKSALTAGLTLAAAAIVTVGIAGPASAATRLGGVDIAQACLQQNGPGFTVVQGSDVMSWRCRYNGGWNYVDLGVNLTTWCKGRYGGTAYAAYTNFNDPYSWGCYR